MAFLLTVVSGGSSGMETSGTLEERKEAIEKIMARDFRQYQEQYADEYEKILDELVAQGRLQDGPPNEWS